MSTEPATPTPPIADTPATPEKPAKPTKKQRTRRERWRRRFFVTVSALLLLGLAFRLLLHVLFPIALDRVARSFGLTATYDKLDLSVLGADVGLWGLKFTPIEGGEPVLTTYYCRGAISAFALLKLQLHVNRVEAEDAQVLLERLPDGSIPLVQKLLASSSTPATPATPAAASELSLEAPLKIDALRLQNARARVRDAMMSPQTDVTLQLDLLVRDVGVADKRTRIELQLFSPETLGALYVTGEGASDANKLDADLAVKMVGLNLLPADQYLAPLGVFVRSGDIAATARAKLTASLTPAAQPGTTRPTTAPAAGSLQATLAFDDVKLIADSIDAASVRSIRLDAHELTPGAIRLADIDVQGVRATVARTADGRLAFGGIELGGTVPPPASQPTTVPEREPAAVAAGGAMPIVEVDRVRVADVSLAFIDRALQPANDVALNVAALELTGLTTDPAKADRPATLTLVAASPGLAKQIDVKGQIFAATPVKTADFTVSVRGINADAVGPYLRPLGIDETFGDGTFACELNGSFEPRADGTQHASIDLVDVTLREADRELFGMPRVAITDASFDPAENHIRLGDIQLVGPTLPMRRDADGTVHLLGFKTTTAVPTAVTPATPAKLPTTLPTSPRNAAMASLPSFEIGKLVWSGSSFAIDDQAAGAEPLSVVLNDVRAEVSDLLLARSASSRSGKVMFAVRAPGLVETIDVDGTVSPSAESIEFDLKGDLTGLTLDRVRGLLRPLNIEPTWRAGSARFALKGDVRADEDGAVYANLHARDTVLSDGDTTWLGVTQADIEGVSFDGRRFDVGRIHVEKPTAVVRRDDGGLVTVAGVKLLQPFDAPLAQSPAEVLVVDSPVPAAPTRIDLSLPIVAKLDELTVTGADVTFDDAFVLPAANLRATANVSLTGFVAGEDAAPADFGMDLACPGIVDELSVNGSFSLAPTSQSLKANVQAVGLTGRAIEPYLPPNIGVDLSQRYAAASFAASLQHDPRGGSNASVELTDVVISSGDGVIVDAGVRAVRLKANRIDLPAEVIAIDEFAVDGATFAAAQDESGLHALGITIAPQPLRPAKPAPAVVEAVAGSTIIDAESLARSAARDVLPAITLDRLSLSADRLAFRTAALAEPVVLTRASLTNAENAPIAIGGRSPQELPPIQLRATAGVERLVEVITAETSISPFANEPLATWNLNVAGIDGNGITTFLPALAETLNGGNLKNASFTTAGEARMKFARRGALGIDLTRDVTGEVIVKETKLAVPTQDRPLVAVGEVRAEKLRVSPASGSVVVGSLDVSKPVASVVRDQDGVHVAGITLAMLKPAATQPTGDVAATEPSQSSEPATQPVVNETTVIDASPASSEMRIDRLTVSGVDFRIEDRVNQPHTVLPIADLDVEVVGLSTRALTEPRPIRMSAVVTAGKVSLPPRKPVVGGPETEEREVFAEASANANLTLVPKPNGYVRASINGLEMTAVRGIAGEYGITLGGGTFDGRLDVRMSGADTFEAKAWPTFNELRMKEVPNGPIQSTFQLPAPPDVIISTLEDVDGSLTFPLVVPIEAGNVKVGPIVASAIGSVGKVLGEAMVAAPLKAAKLAGGMIGLDMSSDRKRGLEPIVIEFPRGESRLSPQQLAQIDRVRELMRNDPTIEVTLQHELGSDDVAIAGDRVNVGTDDSEALARRLQARKAELQRRFAEQRAELTAAMASTSDARRIDAAQQSLRQTASELETTEDGLDNIFDLLRPGADRQATRRTKAAAILLADLRQRSVQEWLQADTRIRDAADRVKRTNALFNAGDAPAGRVRLVLTRRAKS